MVREQLDPSNGSAVKDPKPSDLRSTRPMMVYGASLSIPARLICIYDKRSQEEAEARLLGWRSFVTEPDVSDGLASDRCSVEPFKG